MKKRNVMNDLWEYLAREQEGIVKAVLYQVPEEQHNRCEEFITDYLFTIRYMLVKEIWKRNRKKNSYVTLINEELAKRNIFINSTFIHISMPSVEEYGEED